MDFTSIAFAVFLPVVFALYWIVTHKNLKIQNLFLLAAGYFFYGWWDWRFLMLLWLVSTFNYMTGLKIGDEINAGRLFWFRVGVIVNILTLCFFKYYNFFVDSFIDLISITGYEIPISSLKIILPLGISFYSFLSISYLLDIYKGKIAAHKSYANVLLALSFFPIILAGPIQRPAMLLPQITNRRIFDYSFAVKGLRQILWGLFAKIVVADNLAPRVDIYFQDYLQHDGSTLLVGALMYAIQIYADFSGYSNIAIGVGKLFGFTIIQNFNYPYFSRDITEFWKKWHISLTTWFRDYVFLPISIAVTHKIQREKVGFLKTDIVVYIIASVITWFLTGLWHGANYTFIVWGMIHGVFLILYHLQRKPRKKLLGKLGVRNSNLFLVFIETCLTIGIVLITWIFFRSETILQASGYISGIFSASFFEWPSVNGQTYIRLFMAIAFLFIEWFGRNYEFPLCELNKAFNKRVWRWAFYFVLLFCIFVFSTKEQEFIYFQF
ncbi:MAG: MBOAT family protein [Bacteroidales bacterium]|nr:MBOAT family protein [Bacteroidales bacterium]